MFFFHVFFPISQPSPAGPSDQPTSPRAGGGRLGRRAAGAAGGSCAQRGAGAVALATGAGGGDAAVGHGDPWEMMKCVGYRWLPSGKHTKNYGKLPFIVDFPIKHGDFQ